MDITVFTTALGWHRSHVVSCALGQREFNRRPQISYAPKGKVTCAFQETVLLHENLLTESQEKEREEEKKRRKWGQGRGVRGKGRRRGGG